MKSMFSSKWPNCSLFQVNKQFFDCLVIQIPAVLCVRLTAPCQHFNARILQGRGWTDDGRH